MIPVSIYGYHRIISKKNQGGKYELSEEVFEKHLSLLNQFKFKDLSLDVLADNGRFPNSPPKKIMITFDDGYTSDCLVAMPLLKKYGFSAMFFVTAGLVGTSGYMTRNQVRKLCDAGMSVQSHSFNHVFLPQLPEEKIIEELKKSKAVLEEITGREVAYLSVPGGRISQPVIDVAKRLGYQGIFTSHPGYHHQFSDDFFLMKRFIFVNNTPLQIFINIACQKKIVCLQANFSYNVKRMLRFVMKRP